MEVLDYLQKRLKECSNYELSESDKKFLEVNGLEEFILRVVTNKKYRKWSLDETTKEKVKQAIKLNVLNSSPIQFTFPFGGYKLWSLPTTPEVDWAEFFTIAYFIEYISAILSIYKPGVVFNFSSDDVIVPRMDNIPKEDTDKYASSFNRLLDSFKKYFPGNLEVRLVRIGDFYQDKERFEEELAVKIDDIRKQYNIWSAEKKEMMKKIGRLNICWDGVEDWDRFSDGEKEKRIEEGVILHDAYCALSKRRGFNRADDKIVIFPTPLVNAIPIGTTRNSVAKFWAGVGVLERAEVGKFQDRILSPSQFIKALDLKYEEMEVNLLDLTNFRKIMIFEEPFKFSI